MRSILLGVVILFLLIQLVPYGRDYTNPKVKATPNWPSSEVEQLAAESCADCHSNLTKWPKYARVAPGSWLIKRDVDEGRSALNWSEPCGEYEEIREVVESGEMPPKQYTIIHRNANLSDAEKKTLSEGLDQALTAMSMSECPGGD
jgi:mono/diheme cytochrome c family protein